MPPGENIPFERERRRGVPPKKFVFYSIGLPSVKTVADRHGHAAYNSKHWWQAF